MTTIHHTFDQYQFTPRIDLSKCIAKGLCKLPEVKQDYAEHRREQVKLAMRRMRNRKKYGIK